MERTALKRPEDVAERNIALTGELMRYLLEHQHLFQTLPDQFELIILPDDDPELRLYNRELLDKFDSEGKSVVFVRMLVNHQKTIPQDHLHLYVPVAA